jgi:opacity protein-like surface antigen
MIQRTLTIAALAAAALALSACGDQPQELTGSGVKQDGAHHQGVGASQYAQAGWKAGDRNSWEQQLKARAQYGQNDYTRMTKP